VLCPRVVAVAHPRAVKPCAAARALAAGVGCCRGVVRVLVLAATLEDPGAFSDDEVEARALTACCCAGMRAAVMACEAMPAQAAALGPDRHALPLALLTLPYPALLGRGAGGLSSSHG
jgi:hypothetical protein